eukprot:1744872-Amphidinium_carterae.2
MDMRHLRSTLGSSCCLNLSAPHNNASFNKDCCCFLQSRNDMRTAAKALHLEHRHCMKSVALSGAQSAHRTFTHCSMRWDGSSKQLSCTATARLGRTSVCRSGLVASLTQSAL